MLPRDYHRQHYCKQNSLKLLDNRRTKQILDESLGGIRPAGKMRNGWENKTWKDVPTAQYQNQRAVTRQEWLEEEIWGVHAQERYEEPEEGEEWLQDCSGWGGGHTGTGNVKTWRSSIHWTWTHGLSSTVPRFHAVRNVSKTPGYCHCKTILAATSKIQIFIASEFMGSVLFRSTRWTTELMLPSLNWITSFCTLMSTKFRSPSMPTQQDATRLFPLH